MRRLTGATKGIAYGEDDGTEIAFTRPDADFLTNAYNVDTSFDFDKIDTTAFGDYPFGASEPGFAEITVNIGMRHPVQDGALTADLEFMESHCVTRTPFRIAIVDDRTSLTPNGWILSVIATSLKNSGEAKGAQDNTYALTRAAGALPPKRIVQGVATDIVIAS
jgi:hypothetical protein